MSRIGKQPVEIPKGVKVTIQDRTVRVEGPLGSLEFTHHPEVGVGWSEGEKSVVVSIDESRAGERQIRALWGTTRAVINNMMRGVTQGYQKTMEIVGVGWSAQVQGRKLRMMLGYANPVLLDIPDGLDVSVDRTFVNIKGPDKQKVGQFAAEMRAARKPEPYKGKGVKYSDEVIKRKAGKSFGS